MYSPCEFRVRTGMSPMKGHAWTLRSTPTIESAQGRKRTRSPRLGCMWKDAPESMMSRAQGALGLSGLGGAAPEASCECSARSITACVGEHEDGGWASVQEAMHGREVLGAGELDVATTAARRRALPAGGSTEVGVAHSVARQAWRRAALQCGGRLCHALEGRLGAWSPCTLGNTGLCGPASGRSVVRGWTACSGCCGLVSGKMPSCVPRGLRLDRLRR